MTLDEIAQLRDDWDGQGAVAPSPEVLEAARRFRWPGRPDPDRISAGPNGEILFEWQSDGSYTGRSLYD